MAVKALEKKSLKDLEKDLREKRQKLRDFRFGLAGAGARDIKEGRTLKKEIAQILTELNNR